MEPMDAMDPSVMFKGRDGETRRLPVYLLLDVSSSMAGEPICEVQRGLTEMVKSLRDTSEASDTVFLKLILFSSTIDERPLTPLSAFVTPQITAFGNTALGAALRCLNDGAQYDHDLIRNSREKKGDWLPVVFILTDGRPTDDYKAAAQAIFQRTKGRVGDNAPRLNAFAVGCGADVDTQMLREITENVLLMKEKTGRNLAELFKWITDSIGLQSKSLSIAVGGGTPPPQEPAPLPRGMMWAE